MTSKFRTNLGVFLLMSLRMKKMTGRN